MHFKNSKTIYLGYTLNTTTVSVIPIYGVYFQVMKNIKKEYMVGINNRVEIFLFLLPFVEMQTVI